jgi:hypothetical protein
MEEKPVFFAEKGQLCLGLKAKSPRLEQSRALPGTSRSSLACTSPCWSADGKRAEATPYSVFELTDEAVAAERPACTKACAHLTQFVFILAARKNIPPVHTAGKVLPACRVNDACGVIIADMGDSARPRILPCEAEQFCADRISLDVGQRLEKMAV